MKYTDAKSPYRIKEADIFFNFITFIESIQQKKIETEFDNPLLKSMVLKQVGEQDILQFLPGSIFLPYLEDDIDITCQLMSLRNMEHHAKEVDASMTMMTMKIRKGLPWHEIIYS